MEHLSSSQLYFLGIPWDGTFVAAVIAAVVSSCSWVFLHRQIRSVSDDAKRSENFTRYTTALNLVWAGTNPALVNRGLDVLDALMDSQHINDEDRELAQLALAEYTEPRSSAGGAT